MARAKAILGLIFTLLGIFVLWKLIPVYWSDYKLGRVLEETSIEYTYKKADLDLPKIVVAKAQDEGVELRPEQITVDRTAAELGITAEYTVQVDFLVYNAELHFKTASRNHDVMK